VMKFLKKRPDSPILAEDLRYRLGGDNTRLRQLLLEEQHGFCAYTEKLDEDPLTYDVEHFDPAKKHTGDDYYNYYAVLHTANQRKRKKEGQYRGASFFASRFFQDEQQLAVRVRYVAGEHIYEEAEGDQEAADLIDYLGLNDEPLCRHRRNHARKLRNIFADAGFDEEQKLRFLRENRSELSYPTALEAELGLDLSAVIAAD